MKTSFISIDLGTTRLKVAAFAPDGTLQHAEECRHTETHDGIGRCQDPQAWWRDTLACLSKVSLHLKGHEILGLSLSGRGAAAIFVDSRERVVNQVWFDRRHAKYIETVINAAPELPSVCVQFLAKYAWAKQEIEAEIVRAFFAKDWLLYQLTGEHKTDWATGPDAARWPRGIESLRLPETLLPTPCLPWEIAGYLDSNIASLTGLPAGLPVAVGAHDGLAANIGSGAVHHGDYVVTMGTHAVVRATVATAVEGARHFYRLPPELMIVGGNGLWAGRAIDWYLDLIRHQDAFEILEEVTSKPGADGLFFMPYLGGQSAPERRMDRQARFYGLRLEHDVTHLTRAVLEGTAFAIRAIFTQVQTWGGPVNCVRMTGGGSRSSVWMEILANVLNQRLGISDGYVEARGAAMCLAVALGLHNDIGVAAESMTQVSQEVQPDPEMVHRYDSLFQTWLLLHD